MKEFELYQIICRNEDNEDVIVAVCVDLPSAQKEIENHWDIRFGKGKGEIWRNQYSLCENGCYTVKAELIEDRR